MTSYPILATFLGALTLNASTGLAHAGLQKKQQRDTPGGLPQVLEMGPPTESQALFNLLSNVRRFKSFAEGSRHGVEENAAAEQLRLQAAVNQANSTATKDALQNSISANSLSLLETRKIYTGMEDLANSLNDVLMAATSKGSACEQTVCGAHASCSDTTSGAVCVCNEGFVGGGNGNCVPPPQYYPHSFLVEPAAAALHTHAQDMFLCIFETNKIALVFRDATKGGIGRLAIGQVREAGMVDMSPPEQFATQVYEPQVTGTADKKLAIVWRDDAVNGNGFVKGASLGVASIRGATTAVRWGNDITLCRNQAHKMVVATLPLNRVVVFFQDQTLSTPTTPAQHFGNSALVELGDNGAATLLGTYRFIDAPVCRLAVTKVSDTSFVLAARAGPAVDDVTDVTTQQEASAIYGFMVDNDLVYDTRVLSLEPLTPGQWARGVSLIAPNTVAYAYQQKDPLAIKMAVIEVDPTRHKLNLTHPPVTIREGFSPYIGMLSVPYAPNDPHTAMYIKDPDQDMAQVNVCSWNTHKRLLSNCENFVWMDQTVNEVSGVHLGGGKALMAFAPAGGEPFYTMFGLAKK